MDTVGTGRIMTPPSTKKYRDNWEAVFGKKEKVECCKCKEDKEKTCDRDKKSES